MMYYVKTRLYNKTNGAFAANGVIVRKPGATPGTIDWRFIYKEGTLPHGELPGDSSLIIHFIEPGSTQVELSFESGSPSRLNNVPISTGIEPDSFETLLLSERLRNNSVFANYRVILSEEVLQSDGGPFNVNFDDLFIVEARNAAISSGILIKNGYTQNNIYSGFHGYHHCHRMSFNTPLENDKPYRIGLELELYARTSDDYRKIVNARTNWFQCESDSSLNDRSNPIEMKTIPLKASDATSVDFWREPMSKLSTMAVSKEYTSTGLHVHISKEIFGRTESQREANIKKLVVFYTYFVEKNADAHSKNVKICGREHGYSDPEGAVTDLGNLAMVLGIDNACKNEQAYNIIAESVYNKCKTQRGDINLRHLVDYGTVEFRKGKGSIGATRLAAICTWWEQMCLYCNETAHTDLNFDVFFEKVCREHPCIAYFFNQEQEC